MNSIANLRKTLTRATVAVAVACLASLASNAPAQEKGAERLLKLNQPTATADVHREHHSDTGVMPCPKCKNTFVRLPQATGKGGRIETALVQRHECPTCQTKLVTQGTGKLAKTVIQHSCKEAGTDTATCCAVK